MAQSFQADSICSLWPSCETSVVSDSAFLFPTKRSFFSTLRQLHFHHRKLNSRHARVFCANSNTTRQESGSSSKRRPRKASLSDEELRSELQLFLSSQGLPVNKVPTTKDISNRGRNDLARIVRRRGYKAVNELLNSSDKGPAVKDEIKKTSDLKGNDNDTFTNNHAGTWQSNNVQQIVNGAAVVSRQSDVSDDTGQVVNSYSSIPTQLSNHNSVEFGKSGSSFFSNGSLLLGHTDELLQRKAAAFVKTGQLDHDDDDDDDEDSDVDEEDDNFAEYSSDEGEDDNGNGEVWDGNMTAEEIAIKKAAKLRAKLLPFLEKNVTSELNMSFQSDYEIDTEQSEDKLEDADEGNHEGRLSLLDTQIELQNIKTALSNKEKELEDTLHELEETKAQLALVQAKAAAEVAQAKQIVLEKDIRLKSADQALSNLRQVQVEYWGEGSRVELAGSFNGWNHFIPMQPDPSSEIRKVDGSRGPLMWETELWLYPGTYEIKFIVDGKWVVDKRREMVMHDTLHNNLLRVEP